tara:strand:+ start:510 stop:713 length:204 start_codon:yes stop_codon:yes gene_type:complete
VIEVIIYYKRLFSNTLGSNKQVIADALKIGLDYIWSNQEVKAKKFFSKWKVPVRYYSSFLNLKYSKR